MRNAPDFGAGYTFLNFARLAAKTTLQSFQLAKITTLSRSEALPNTWRHIDPCQTRFRLAFEAVHSGHFGGTPHESAVGSNLTKFGFLEALQQSREI